MNLAWRQILPWLTRSGRYACPANILASRQTVSILATWRMHWGGIELPHSLEPSRRKKAVNFGFQRWVLADSAQAAAYRFLDELGGTKPTGRSVSNHRLK